MTTAYSPIYRRYIDEKNSVKPNQMVRAKFYQIKQYEYVDGTKGRYSDANAPIIFTLFVSKVKDIVHIKSYKKLILLLYIIVLLILITRL